MISNSNTRIDARANTRDRGIKFKLALLSLTILNLSAAYDATCISVALPTIAHALHGTAIDAFWVGAAFLLVNTVFQPIWISVSDAFGRRAALLAGAFLFMVGSTVCGSAHAFPQLLTGRAIQGLGGGGVMCLSEVVITDLVPLSERPKYIIFVTSAWALGSVVGPVIGGAIIEKSSWRWLFLSPLPPTAIGAAMVFFFLNLHQRNEGAIEKLKRIDYIGSFLFIGSLTSLLLGLTWGGVMYPWTSFRTLVPLCVGAAGLACFVLYELYVARKGLSTVIPVDIFKTRTACATFWITFIHGKCMYLGLYYMPLFFEGVKQFGPTHAGVAIFPLTLTVVPVSIVASIITKRRQAYRWTHFVGWPLVILGSGLCYMLDANTTTAQWVLYTLIPSAGLGIVFPGLATANIAAAPDKFISTTAGMVPFFRSFGQTMGVVIGGALFQNRFKELVRASPELDQTVGQYAQDATAVVEFVKTLSDSSMKAQIKSVFAESLKSVWAFQCGIAGSAFLAAFLIRAYTMNREQVTEHGWIGATITGASGLESGMLDKGEPARKDSGYADSVLVAKVPWSQAIDTSHSVYGRDLRPVPLMYQQYSIQSRPQLPGFTYQQHSVSRRPSRPASRFQQSSASGRSEPTSSGRSSVSRSPNDLLVNLQR